MGSISASILSPPLVVAIFQTGGRCVSLLRVRGRGGARWDEGESRLERLQRGKHPVPLTSLASRLAPTSSSPPPALTRRRLHLDAAQRPHPLAGKGIVPSVGLAGCLFVFCVGLRVSLRLRHPDEVNRVNK